jgi:hypothetical protein
MTEGITQRVSWSATDPSGICGYDVFRVYNGQAPQPVVKRSAQRSFTDTTTDYDDQQGGGSFKVSGWRVVAHDCAGNVTTRTTRVLPVVTQENNRTYGYRGVEVAFSGAWTTATCACWSGRQARHSSTAGDSATITRIWSAGDQVALVSEQGPDRGAFDVYVDGVRRTSVDTNAATRTHRAVVWSSPMSAGDHTITLVNLASAGHPRVDFDAVLSNSALYCFC